MSTKASSTVEGSIVQNGELAASSAVPAPQLPLQVSHSMIILRVYNEFPMLYVYMYNNYSQN